VEQPELVAQPDDACLTAAWFWHTNKLNALAEAGALDEITQADQRPRDARGRLRRQYTREALLAMAA
jgi:HAMP domain-containing protein